MLSTWGNVQNSIPSEIIFWWCVELGITKPSDQMKINFKKLWSEGRNDYNLAIGLDSATVANLEDYFVCRLGIKSVSITETTIRPAMIEEANLVSPQKTSQKKEILKNTVPRKEGVVTTPSNTYKKPLPSPVSDLKKPTNVQSTEEILKIISTTKPEGGFDLEGTAPVMQAKLQRTLDLHKKLKGCVDVIPVDINTMEIKVTGCGLANKGLFDIMETSNVVTQDFYDVCGNLVYIDILKPFKEEFGGQLRVSVIGTADTLVCRTCNNDTLAYQRALGVVNYMAPELITAIGGKDKVIIIPRTNDLERKVIIRIELIYPSQKGRRVETKK